MNKSVTRPIKVLNIIFIGKQFADLLIESSPQAKAWINELADRGGTVVAYEAPSNGAELAWIEDHSHHPETIHLIVYDSTMPHSAYSRDAIIQQFERSNLKETVICIPIPLSASHRMHAVDTFISAVTKWFLRGVPNYKPKTETDLAQVHNQLRTALATVETAIQMLPPYDTYATLSRNGHPGYGFQTFSGRSRQWPYDQDLNRFAVPVRPGFNQQFGPKKVEVVQLFVEDDAAQTELVKFLEGGGIHVLGGGPSFENQFVPTRYVVVQPVGLLCGAQLPQAAASPNTKFRHFVIMSEAQYRTPSMPVSDMRKALDAKGIDYRPTSVEFLRNTFVELNSARPDFPAGITPNASPIHPYENLCAQYVGAVFLHAPEAADDDRINTATELIQKFLTAANLVVIRHPAAGFSDQELADVVIRNSRSEYSTHFLMQTEFEEGPVPMPILQTLSRSGITPHPLRMVPNVNAVEMLSELGGPLMLSKQMHS